MNRKIICLWGVVILLACQPAQKPFIRMTDQPTYNFYPDHNLPAALTAATDEERIVPYLNGLLANQQLNEAVYFANQYLLFHPQTPLADYLLFKKLKVQFLQNLLSEYYKGSPGDQRNFYPRTYIRYEGIAESLNKYLTKEGFKESPDYTKETFDKTSYPADSDMQYLLALLTATRTKLDSIRFVPDQTSWAAEKDSFGLFLKDFAQELVWLRTWAFIKECRWDSAATYADSMSMLYPEQKDSFQKLHTAIKDRPILPEKKKGIAMLGSLVVPGLGSVYAGCPGHGLKQILFEAAQAGLAFYFLSNIDTQKDKAELFLGGTLSLTAVLTHLHGLKVARQDVEDYNTKQKDNERRLFVRGLDAPPPGTKAER